MLARVHSSCVTGDIFHSARCDCGPQLDDGDAPHRGEGRGVLLYLNQEGRGIGLANKIRAYSLQDEGLDTVEANERLGFPADMREYRAARRDAARSRRPFRPPAEQQPEEAGRAGRRGLPVSERMPIENLATAATRHYLKTKKDKLGHFLESVSDSPGSHPGSWTAWPALAAALVLLNASLTFGNVWPTPKIRWENALSVELAVCVLLLALLHRHAAPG